MLNQNATDAEKAERLVELTNLFGDLHMKGKTLESADLGEFNELMEEAKTNATMSNMYTDKLLIIIGRAVKASEEAA